jgi:predicted NACHT family NTPase
LQELKAQLLNIRSNEEIYLQWWKINGKNWIKRLNAVMIEQRNIGHDWQFTQPQMELLSQYYSANQLLVDCLNSDCYVSREVRQEIEDTLLLPMAEIENLSSNRFVSS